MYKMLGADGKVYGPVSAEAMRKWITEGRATAQTQVMQEGVDTAWKPLSSCPEFTNCFAPPGMPPPSAFVAPKPAKTSAMAITSLVLGILGFCTMGITAVIGLVLGIVAMLKIRKSEGQLGGMGLAIAGTCVSGVMVLMLPLLAAIAIPNFVKARSAAQTAACRANLRQIDGAKAQWALENKKELSDTPAWSDLVGPGKYLGAQPACPANGTYTIGSMSKQPTCSEPNHSIDAKWPGSQDRR